jgi:type IV pilus assembly protein PilB
VRLVPDPRETPLDAAELAAMFGSATGHNQRLIEQLVAEHARSGGALGRLLLDLVGVDDRAFAQAIASRLGIPLADLSHREPTPRATAFVDPADARRLGVLPLHIASGDLLGGDLSVALIDPLDPEVYRFLESLTVARVSLHVAPAIELAAAMNRAYPALAHVGEHVEAFAQSDVALAASAMAALDAGAASDDAPIIQLVNELVTQALRDRASDVHIEPTNDRVRIRFRIDGALTEVLDLPTGVGPALASRIKIMADLNIVERRRPQDGQFETTVDDRDVDVRVSTTATIWGEKVVLRLLDKSRSLMRLGDLGMPPELEQAYQRIVRSPHGMVIASGPTGSGKTTTLYATLSDINRVDLNVMTIEDPVEYIFPSINQIQINPHADVTFATGLRSILRQDPDVILVGEIRDAETARIAVQSALTGHLVLSSMHAVDSVSGLYRLLDMGIEPFLVASSVNAIVAQRLVRRICGACAGPYTPDPAERDLYAQLEGPSKDCFVVGMGCNLCANTGFRGRVGVYEVLTVTDELRQAVLEHRPLWEARALAAAQGLRTLQVEAIRLVAEDVTTIREVMSKVFVVDVNAGG